MHFETDIFHRKIPSFVSYLALFAFVGLTYYIVRTAYTVNSMSSAWSSAAGLVQ